MPKFLNVKVSNEQRQLVSADDVVLVEQATLTTTTITYHGGKVVTLTHDSLGSGEEIIRDEVESILIDIHRKADIVIDFDPSYACTGIAVA